MTGALMQLVSYGAQDIYLTGNPMITYFKTVYRRHTNFATEIIPQSFTSGAAFGKKVTALVNRNGDLMSRITVAVNLPHLECYDTSTHLRWTDNVGHHLLETIEIEIGGQIIDRHYGDWLEIWSQLTVTAEHRQGYYELIGQDPVDILGRPTGLQRSAPGSYIEGRALFIPLQFWFCRNYGLSLPLLALNHHEVKINIQFAHLESLVRCTRGGDIRNHDPRLQASLLVEYIYLDEEERRRFIQTNHEYLIEQLQRTVSYIVSSSNRAAPTTHHVPLPFHHPVKELLWVVQPTEFITGVDKQPSNYTSVKAPYVDPSDLNITTDAKLRDVSMQSCVRPAGGSNPVLGAKLVLNNVDRICRRPGSYFNWVHPEAYHTCIPASPGINIYSFAVIPESHQPSGACNFSRIQNATLIIDTAVLTTYTEHVYRSYPGLGTDQSSRRLNTGNCQCRVYAINYNVLRVMQGMAGLAYQLRI